MASLCRFAAAASGTVGGASRSIASSARRLDASHLLPESSRLLSFEVSCTAIGSVVELSVMPRHSAEASARLRSFIAVNSSSWNWLTQGQGFASVMKL